MVQLFWVRGQSTATQDLRRAYLIFEADFDLRQLKDFGSSNFDLNKVRLTHSSAFIKTEFSPYCERYCRLLGIHTDAQQALRLLHRTQSAKNLGDLNQFLRTFMLDTPKTFEVATRLIDEFTELNSAHKAVLEARDQKAMLTPVREAYRAWEHSANEKSEMESYRDHEPYYREMQRAALVKSRIAELDANLVGLRAETSRCRAAESNEDAIMQDLRQRHQDAGGGSIERWEAEKLSIEAQMRDRIHRRDLFENACRSLKWSVPLDPLAFGKIVGEARQEIESSREFLDSIEQQDRDLYYQKCVKAKKLEEAQDEIEALRRNTSNIPRQMQELRRSIAIGVGISEESLPFVGELLEVKAEQAEWQGAIERLLHGFALSLLVDQRHYREISAFINRTDLKQRLVYYRTDRMAADISSMRPVALESIYHKINIKNCSHTDWLKAELRTRFDYTCATSLAEFNSTDGKAVTREGQIKHGRSMHEKDDRFPIDDQRRWVLGFDSREKLAAWRRDFETLHNEILVIDADRRDLKVKAEDKRTRQRDCDDIVNTTWEEIDVRSLSERVASIDAHIRRATETNVDLRELTEKTAAQQKRLSSAHQATLNAEIREGAEQRERDRFQNRLNELQIPLGELPANIEQALAAQYLAASPELTIDTIDATSNKVSTSIRDRLEALGSKIRNVEKEIERSLAAFLNAWPAETGNLQANIESAPDFIGKLARLESDNLPAYEERFFELLQEQSHQHLATLSSYLKSEKKEIRDRMDTVNETLVKVPFNRDGDCSTYLRIKVQDKQSEDVRLFKQDIAQVLQNSMTDEGEMDRALAEQRFEVLSKKIVARLSSNEAMDKHWRDAVLDVRKHVEFIGQEIDDDGDSIETHTSGSGKSGGQRQKLALTCLAAALAYQLGSLLNGMPTYAAVILDEAFGKEDADFTALSLSIFRNFGFQVLIATPFQKVMTIHYPTAKLCRWPITPRASQWFSLKEIPLKYGGESIPERATATPPFFTSATMGRLIMPRRVAGVARIAQAAAVSTIEWDEVGLFVAAVKLILLPPVPVFTQCDSKWPCRKQRARGFHNHPDSADE
jgi:uncharacterized protein YPO0396